MNGELSKDLLTLITHRRRCDGNGFFVSHSVNATVVIVRSRRRNIGRHHRVVDTITIGMHFHAGTSHFECLPFEVDFCVQFIISTR